MQAASSNARGRSSSDLGETAASPSGVRLIASSFTPPSVSPYLTDDVSFILNALLPLVVPIAAASRSGANGWPPLASRIVSAAARVSCRLWVGYGRLMSSLLGRRPAAPLAAGLCVISRTSQKHISAYFRQFTFQKY